MARYVRHNQNPFGKSIGDCAVRSLSEGLGVDYEKICQMLGKGFEEGYGLKGDVILNDLSDFSKRYGLIKPVRFDKPLFDYIYRKKPYVSGYDWPSLREFTDENIGKYIVLVRDGSIETKDSDLNREIIESTFHVIFADGDLGCYYDRMRNDPGSMKVYGLFKIV